MRHWQPLLRRYKTALKTSCKSTVRGLARLRTPSRIGRIDLNCSRLTSLGYGFLGSILLDYRTGNADAYGSADTLATTGLIDRKQALRASSSQKKGLSNAINRDGAYRCTRCKTTGMLEGRWKDGFLEGSDPLGGGPMAGCWAAGVSGCGIRKGNSTFRWRSIRSPVRLPE